MTVREHMEAAQIVRERRARAAKRKLEADRKARAIPEGFRLRQFDAVPENIEIRYSSDTTEYRVNFVGGREATAYYTTDRQDAIESAALMSKEPNR